MLFDLARSAIEAGEQCVLATVVRLNGSGYGRPGARLLMTESGERAGYISGGCLEKDLCRRVWDATARGPKLIAFDTRGNALNPGTYNTGCDGVVYVLCQRLQSRGSLSLTATHRSTEKNEVVKFATIYRSDSSEFLVGDSVTVNGDGSSDVERFSQTNMDADVVATLCRISNESNQTKSILISDSVGATIEIFVEVIEPPSELVVFGAGDDVVPLYQMAVQLGWSVTIVGRRAELADPKRFPGAKVFSGNTPEIAASLAIGARTKCVLMTHDFEQDVRLLPVLLDSPAAQIGILGPKRRLGRLIWQIAQRGYSLQPKDSERIHAPIGLDIGATNPQEIAVSIVAELIARSHSREGGFLHNRRQMLNVPHLVENRTVAAIEPAPSDEVDCALAVCETRL